MRTFTAVALAALATAAAASSAMAADGCGRGYHRGPYGHCRPNWGGGPAVVAVAPGALVVDQWYPGHGYWDGHRYWMHRDRWHDGWRYR
jgi:hypothetical protein